MDEITRPLLAETVEDFATIQYPVLATPKLDGIRCLRLHGKALSRKFKPIPNVHIRELLEANTPDGLDGEIMTVEGEFCELSSQVMSQKGEPAFVYNVFDFVSGELTEPYFERIKKLVAWYETSCIRKDLVKILVPVCLENEADLLAYETKCLEDGFEGIIIRKPDGRYKCGRSTVKEGILLKIKRFTDAEATIVGFEEKMKNNNEQERNEWGMAKRSSKQEGMAPCGTLGAFVVENRSLWPNQFNLGTGLNDEIRAKVWAARDSYLGKLVKFKFQAVGMKGDAPRFPVFLGFRSEDDL